jgi:uncharacterized protein (DUF1684 family)
MRSLTYLGVAAFLLLSCNANTEDPVYRQEIAAERMEMNEHFFNPKDSPLDSANFVNFKGLKFFPVNEKYRIPATLTLLENQEVFELPHSHERSKPYKQYAKVAFQFEGNRYELIVLEQAQKRPGLENYLLLPFTDETTGKTSYGGGRYIDLDKSAGTKITIDFNRAYHPYCVYNDDYTCPIPPKENKLPFAVEAGIKLGD